MTILSEPLLVFRIWFRVRLLAGRVDGEEFRWRLGGGLGEAPQPRTLKGRNNLGKPHSVVAAGELLRHGRKKTEGDLRTYVGGKRL